MVDRLRDAAAQLEAPICPDCHVEMRWFRSELLQDAPVSIILHEFVCPSCKRADSVKGESKEAPKSPGKLSAPRFFAHAA